MGCFGKASFPQVPVLLGNDKWGWLGRWQAAMVLGMVRWEAHDGVFHLRRAFECDILYLVSGGVCPPGGGTK